MHITPFASRGNPVLERYGEFGFYNYGLWFWTGAPGSPTCPGVPWERTWAENGFFQCFYRIREGCRSLPPRRCHVSETTGSLAASQAASPPAISIRLVIPCWCRIPAAIEER